MYKENYYKVWINDIEGHIGIAAKTRREAAKAAYRMEMVLYGSDAPALAVTPDEPETDRYRISHGGGPQHDVVVEFERSLP